jgi:hypothetical protein
MTLAPDERRSIALVRLENARQTLADARLLQERGSIRSAVNRAPAAKTGVGDMPGYTEVAGEDGHASLRRAVVLPNPRFTVSNGTVRDNLTGLIWLKNANVPNATRTWATALSDVAQLNTAGTMNGRSAGDTSSAGSHQTDWRLPNVQELQSLVDYGRAGPALCDTVGTGQWSAGNPFDNVQSSLYWSGTTLWEFGTYAWFVHLYHGVVNNDFKTVAHYVWPVRGGERARRAT